MYDSIKLETGKSVTTDVIATVYTRKGLPLNQNLPNTFNPEATIHYSLNKHRFVIFTIYDVSGRKIEKLVNKFNSPGLFMNVSCIPICRQSKIPFYGGCRRVYRVASSRDEIFRLIN